MDKHTVLFADLDGTLIETITGKFPVGIWDMKFKFHVLNAIKNLSPDYLFIVSNQCGISSGYVDEHAFKQKLDYICTCLRQYCNIPIVEGAYCSHCYESNPHRKPNVGMLESFASKHQIDKENCLMIGDSSGEDGQWSDTDRMTANNFKIDYLDVKTFVAKYGTD